MTEAELLRGIARIEMLSLVQSRALLRIADEIEGREVIAEGWCAPHSIELFREWLSTKQMRTNDQPVSLVRRRTP